MSKTVKPEPRLITSVVVLIGLGWSAAAYAQKGVFIEDVAKLAEKYALNATTIAAQDLPKIIDDAASTDPARQILLNSASTLPVAQFLQISATGAYRLYRLNSDAQLIAVTGNSLAEVLSPEPTVAPRFLIVDQPSAATHLAGFESVHAKVEPYTVRDSQPPIPFSASNATLVPTEAAAAPAASYNPRKSSTWTATDVVVLAFLGILIFVGAKRFWNAFRRDFEKGYHRDG